MIRPHLRDIINDHKWKIQLPLSINFISSKDSNETRIMRSKSDNIEIMMGSETDETMKERFESPLKGYEEILKESMRVSEFVFNSADLLY